MAVAIILVGAAQTIINLIFIHIFALQKKKDDCILEIIKMQDNRMEYLRIQMDDHLCGKHADFH